MGAHNDDARVRRKKVDTPLYVMTDLGYVRTGYTEQRLDREVARGDKMLLLLADVEQELVSGKHGFALARVRRFLNQRRAEIVAAETRTRRIPTEQPDADTRVKPKTIGVVGSRRRNSYEDFELCLAAIHVLYVPGDLIVSGGCKKGADRFAEQIAEQWELPIRIHYPQFDLYDVPICYFARNTLIAKDCDELIAIVALDRTGGTEDTVRKAERLGKRVWVVTDASSPIFSRGSG